MPRNIMAHDRPVLSTLYADGLAFLTEKITAYGDKCVAGGRRVVPIDVNGEQAIGIDL